MDVILHIKELTEERHWTQYRLAKEAELPQTTIANIFRCGTTPSIATLEMLCKAFQISLSDFFMEETAGADHITEQEKRLINYCRALTSEQQELIAELAKHMNDKVS